MKIRIKKTRLAFPVVREPKAFGDDAKPRYSCSLITGENPDVELLDDKDANDKPKVVKLNAAIDLVAKEKWKDKAAANIKAIRASGKSCFRSGDDKANYDGFPGNWYISAARKPEDGAPMIVDEQGRQLPATSGKPYGGCYVTATLDLWAQDNKYGKRINATLRGLQFTGDGDAFSASTPASEDEFETESTDAADLV